MKNAWKIINEVIDNTKNKQEDLPEKLIINKSCTSINY